MTKIHLNQKIQQAYMYGLIEGMLRIGKRQTIKEFGTSHKIRSQLLLAIMYTAYQAARTEVAAKFREDKRLSKLS